MTEQRQKLFDELIINRETWVSDWFEDYSSFTGDIQKIGERLLQNQTTLFDNELYEGLKSFPTLTYEGFGRKLVWDLKNGIASRGQSVISQSQLDLFLQNPEFEEYIRRIILNPLDNDLFVGFNEWWKKQPGINHNRVLINRIFAASAPAELSTVVDECKFNKLFGWLQSKGVIGQYEPFLSQDTWLARNIFMMKDLHKVNRGGLSGAWISIFPWLLFEYMENQMKKSAQKKKPSLVSEYDVALGGGKSHFGPFYSGLVIGSGKNEYAIKRVTVENIELIRTATNTERFIPTVVIKALCVALDLGVIELAELERRQNKAPVHIFDKIGLNHDKYIMGYDATISKLCEYYFCHKDGDAEVSIADLLDSLSFTSLFAGEANAFMCSAALAKRFVIFTGLSGSGKTLQALSFAKWICADKSQVDLIAVGADWTSNENLLGYPDALNPGHYRKPDNGALDLILRAQNDEKNPYFLILDEMNLSHVERYFADFLSSMESGEAISLHDDTGDDWDAGDGSLKVPAKLNIPKNLFVIGTVNVDETTYMFSPKVLDRANVIEFRVSDDEMKTFLEKPVKPDLDSIAGQGEPYARAFVAAATQKDVPLDDELKKQVSEVLMEFFPELKEAGAEFGYRTAYEICRFVYFHKTLSEQETWSINSAMDAAIMQKLLPKLHGSKKKLGKVLAVLIWHCLKEDARPEKMDTPVKDEDLTKDNALYPGSVEKLARMHKRLVEHGFTSFAEA